MSTRLGNRLGCRYPGMRGRDYLVTCFDSQAAQCDVQSVCAVGAGHAMLSLAHTGPLSLEFLDKSTADVTRLADDCRNGGVNFGAHAQVLGIKINKRHCHCRRDTAENLQRKI